MLEQCFCKVCGERMLKVEHYEVDGVTSHGSYEPYFECPNLCEEPEVKIESIS